MGKNQESLSLEVYNNFKKTYKKVKKDLREKLTETGYTWTQLHALYHIEDEGIPVNELAKELRCNASNITGLIDRMKEKDLVFRQHSTEDRRVWLVKLTDKGSQLKSKLYPEHRKNIKQRMQCLSHEELNNLKSILKKLHNNGKEADNIERN